jgi:hypothetical protein
MAGPEDPVINQNAKAHRGGWADGRPKPGSSCLTTEHPNRRSASRGNTHLGRRPKLTDRGRVALNASSSTFVIGEQSC